MKYNFDFAVSAELSPAVIQGMIKSVVEEQTGRKVSKVVIKMEMVSSGYQRDEHQTPALTGATVHFEKDNSNE